MIKPNFLIIGAAKAGTTTISYALEQHPEAYMSSTKETNFFALKGQKLNFFEGSVSQEYLENCSLDLKSYQRQFISSSRKVVVGEASPSYLYFPHVAQEVKAYNPEMKLIAVLRNPADRAYSNFLHHIRDGLETTEDFTVALALENERIEKNWWWGFHYTKAGLYYSQLKRYFDIFPRENIKVYLFEELYQDPLRLVQGTFDFLDIDQNFCPDLSIRQNKTGTPKNKLLNKFLRDRNLVKAIFKPLIPTALRKKMIASLNEKNLEKPHLSAELRRQIVLALRDDMLKLQDLIEKDLSPWLQQ